MNLDIMDIPGYIYKSRLHLFSLRLAEPSTPLFPLGVGAPQRCVGFVPGDFTDVAVSRDLNRVPIKDDFRPEGGQLFRLHHRTRRAVHRRAHLPNVLAHGPAEMRPKWLSAERRAEASHEAAPIEDEAAGNAAGEEAARVAFENGVTANLLHPDVDVGPMGADDNAATRVAPIVQKVAKEMPKTKKYQKIQPLKVEMVNLVMQVGL